MYLWSWSIYPRCWTYLWQCVSCVSPSVTSVHLQVSILFSSYLSIHCWLMHVSLSMISGLSLELVIGASHALSFLVTKWTPHCYAQITRKSNSVSTSNSRILNLNLEARHLQGFELVLQAHIQSCMRIQVQTRKVACAQVRRSVRPSREHKGTAPCLWWTLGVGRAYISLGTVPSARVTGISVLTYVNVLSQLVNVVSQLNGLSNLIKSDTVHCVRKIGNR